MSQNSSTDFAGGYFPESAENFRKLLDFVKGKNIAVVGHMRPDGDCISSQLAAAHIFRKAGAAKVVCVNKDPVPYLYKEFLGGENFVFAEDFAEMDFEIVTVDCADYARISPTFHERFPNPLAAIDHHVSNGDYAKISIVESTAAAAAELIAGLMLDAQMEISENIATILYMGVMTDTRQLTTSNTCLKTFKITERLVAQEVNPAEVSILLYQRERFARMKLLAHFLNTLTMHYDGQVCIGLLPQGIYEKLGATKEDSDGLVDYARNVDGVEIAAILEALPDGGVKGSLRSKHPETKVNEIAAHFGGGGHFAAAGFNVKMSMDEFYPKLLATIGKHLQK